MQTFSSGVRYYQLPTLVAMGIKSDCSDLIFIHIPLRPSSFQDLSDVANCSENVSTLVSFK